LAEHSFSNPKLGASNDIDPPFTTAVCATDQRLLDIDRFAWARQKQPEARHRLLGKAMGLMHVV
jgi:hypothetical protein